MMNKIYAFGRLNHKSMYKFSEEEGGSFREGLITGNMGWGSVRMRKTKIYAVGYNKVQGKYQWWLRMFNGKNWELS